MELIQESRSFGTIKNVLDTVAEQLVDVDLSMPDYCPDIEKILKCTLTPKIQTNSLSGGQLQVDGYCVVNVMYVESIKKTIRCCEQSVSFSQSFSIKETPDNPVILVNTKSEYINCRALSPRRLVIHGAFSLYAKVLSMSRTKLYLPDDDCLETYKRSVNCADLKSLCQEQFAVSEEISVSDKPTIESILHTDLKVSISEIKAVTGKLMLNGELNLKMLYLTNVEDGETAKLDYLLPFNQIIDCEGIDENTINFAECNILSYDIRLKNDVMSDKPMIVIDAKLSLTERGYVMTEENIITDAYSVLYASQAQFGNIKVAGDMSCLNDSHMEKISVNVDDGKLSKIIDIYCDNVSCEASINKNEIKIFGKINMCILALNESNIPVFIERSADYNHTFANTEFNYVSSCKAQMSSISYRLADDNTVEVRCELRLSVTALQNDDIKVVNDVEIFSDKPNKQDECALTLYFAKEGESLWDIAKSHNTKLELLINENSAEGQTLESPKMLLIPRA